MQEKYIGPFILKQKLSDVLFKITDLTGKAVKAPIHVNRMKPFTDPDDESVRKTSNQNDDSEDEIPLATLRKRLRHQPKVNTIIASNDPRPRSILLNQTPKRPSIVTGRVSLAACY